jgi:subtilisin family serine protease
LPSGALLAATVATAAAVAVTAAVPALAATGTPAGATAKADKIRDSEWWLSSLHVTQAWQASRGSGITVALLSTGVLTTHPDLTGSVTTGPDYTGSGETSASTGWGIEGTSAASIIAGHGDNTGDASGIIGIAPAARILSVRVAFDAADPLNASPTDVGRLPDAIAEGIRYGVAQGAKVIDLPLDPSTLASDGADTSGLGAAAGGSVAERSAVSYAESKGVVLVAPAGDNGDDGNTASVPASYPGVVAVGAVDQHGKLGVFSARQSYVALTAPGVGVTAASQPSGYRNMSTTDASSAVAAGIAALIRSKYPNLTGSQVRQALINGSTKSAAAAAKQVGAGAGTVDAHRAVLAAAAIANPQPTAQPSLTPSSPPATSGVVAPLTAQPKPSTAGMAKSALRDAAYAAGALIVLLLGVLLGLRLWRRRSGPEVQPVSEQPRTLLDAPLGPPSGPQPIPASSARHARAAEEFAFAPAGAGLAASPRDAGSVPDTVSPRFAPPGVMPLDPGDLNDVLSRAPEPAPPPAGPEEEGAEGGRTRRSRGGRSAAARTGTRNQESGPGGPPWAAAPAPATEALPEPWRRPPDPFSRAARPVPLPPAPWDAAGPSAAGPGPAGTLRPSGPNEPRGHPLDDPLSGPDRPRRDPGLPGTGGPELPGTGARFTPRPALGGPAPIAWRPIPPAGTPLPGVPAPPGGPSGPAMGIPTPPEGLPAVPATGPASPASPVPPGSPPRPTPPAGFPRPGADANPPAGGWVSSGGSAAPAGLSDPDPSGGPGEPRPISPWDRLPLQESGAPDPAAPAPAPSPPAAWRIPGSSDRFPGAGAGASAPEGSPAGEPGWPRDGYPGRTGRLSRSGEFLPPYAGRPAPDPEPEPGPAPAGPPPAAETDGIWTDESPSGPLYIWNPAALTEPFPTSPGSSRRPAPPPDDDDDPRPHPHRA